MKRRTRRRNPAPASWKPDPFKIEDRYLRQFVLAYIGAALWSTNDESNEQGGEPMDANYDYRDLSDSAYGKILKDCEKFCVENAGLLDDMDPESAGHDFWLTRNGHGVGFWDRGLGVLGDQLTEAAEKFKEVDLYVGDDGKIYA